MKISMNVNIYSESLQQIDRNDKEMLKEIASEMGLSSIEFIKFKLILKHLPVYEKDDSLEV